MVKLQRNIQLSKRRKYNIKTTEHNGAFAVSGERTIFENNINRIQNIVAEEFKAMDQWVLERGGIIGHIKGLISADSNSVMISTTGDEVTCRTIKSRDIMDEGVKISLVSIVFNISQLELEERMILMLDSLLDP